MVGYRLTKGIPRISEVRVGDPANKTLVSELCTMASPGGAWLGPSRNGEPIETGEGREKRKGVYFMRDAIRIVNIGDLTVFRPLVVILLLRATSLNKDLLCILINRGLYTGDRDSDDAGQGDYLKGHQSNSRKPSPMAKTPK